MLDFCQKKKVETLGVEQLGSLKKGFQTDGFFRSALKESLLRLIEGDNNVATIEALIDSTGLDFSLILGVTGLSESDLITIFTQKQGIWAPLTKDQALAIAIEITS